MKIQSETNDNVRPTFTPYSKLAMRQSRVEKYKRALILVKAKLSRCLTPYKSTNKFDNLRQQIVTKKLAQTRNFSSHNQLRTKSNQVPDILAVNKLVSTPFDSRKKNLKGFKVHKKARKFNLKLSNLSSQPSEYSGNNSTKSIVLQKSFNASNSRIRLSKLDPPKVKISDMKSSCYETCYDSSPASSPSPRLAPKFTFKRRITKSSKS